MPDFTENHTSQEVPSAITLATPAINRKYKDALFRWIFEKKEDLLSLYNAVNDSHYEDPNQLEITTIDDVLYLGMKNDVSFLIDQYMNLYEHQSTWNPNMPLRGLFYFSRLYQAYVKQHDLDLFGEDLAPLPTPNYIVFYNGKKEEPDCQTLLLSSAYQHKTDAPYRLECTATVLNINVGHNLKLMEQCDKLNGYACFVNLVRTLRDSGMSLRDAIDQAVDECVQKNLLRDFLIKHRTEVMDMLLCEDDYLTKVHMDAVKKKLDQRKDALDQEKNALDQQKNALDQQKNALDQQKNALDQEKNALDQQKNELKQEKDTNARDRLAIECTRIRWVCKLMQKRMPAEEIAEDLGESVEQVTAIMAAANAFAPDYDPEKIYQAMTAG